MPQKKRKPAGANGGSPIHRVASTATPHSAADKKSQVPRLIAYTLSSDLLIVATEFGRAP